MNLYDLTKGNYRVVRTVTYPEFPKSKIIFETDVKAAGDSEWATTIHVDGTYNGPSDIVAIKDYQLIWTTDGKNILESGTAKLELASGKFIRQVWSSTITPEQGIQNFPKAGELVNVSVSPFKVDGNKMSYEWEGTVTKQSEKTRM